MAAEPVKRPDVVLLSEFLNYDSHEFSCPGCGDRYVYPLFSKMRTDTETDEYTSPAGERGPWIEIPMACENCDSEGEEGFSVVLAFHKGQTYLTVLGRLPNWDNPKLIER